MLVVFFLVLVLIVVAVVAPVNSFHFCLDIPDEWKAVIDEETKRGGD